MSDAESARPSTRAWQEGLERGLVARGGEPLARARARGSSSSRYSSSADAVERRPLLRRRDPTEQVVDRRQRLRGRLGARALDRAPPSLTSSRKRATARLTSSAVSSRISLIARRPPATRPRAPRRGSSGRSRGGPRPGRRAPPPGRSRLDPERRPRRLEVAPRAALPSPRALRPGRGPARSRARLARDVGEPRAARRAAARRPGSGSSSGDELVGDPAVLARVDGKPPRCRPSR